MNTSFRIEGLDKLAAKLRNLQDLKFIKAVLRAAGETVKKHIAKYPPATSANAPSTAPGSRWYERGEGGHYIRIRDGGESIYRTSETLGRSWTTTTKDSGMTVIVGAHAKYAPYVQDKEKQSPWHTAHGWSTVQDVIEEDGPKVTEQLKDAIDKELSK